jgi:hypothetical protein
MLPVSLECSFLIAPLVFSNVYLFLPKGQSRMNNPEKLETLGTQDTGRRKTKQINVRENQRGNQE